MQINANNLDTAAYDFCFKYPTDNNYNKILLKIANPMTTNKKNVSVTCKYKKHCT